MSERKVLSKYYPPDFDPRQLQRQATKGAGPQLQTVRLMSPFSMLCTSCGEYIGKGRKFNARKSTPDEKYLGIQIFRFFIRGTRCSSEITFRTDPQTSDYVCEAGAKRNTELGLNTSKPGKPDEIRSLRKDEVLNVDKYFSLSR